MNFIKLTTAFFFMMSTLVLSAQSDTIAVQEHKAEFIGKGKNPLANFISANIVVPKNYSDVEINGTIKVQFTINNQGCVSDVQVIEFSTLSQEYKDAAVDVIQKTECNWVPATQLGKPVSMQIVVPITFNNPGVKHKTKKKN